MANTVLLGSRGRKRIEAASKGVWVSCRPAFLSLPGGGANVFFLFAPPLSSSSSLILPPPLLPETQASVTPPLMTYCRLGLPFSPPPPFLCASSKANPPPPFCLAETDAFFQPPFSILTPFPFTHLSRAQPSAFATFSLFFRKGGRRRRRCPHRKQSKQKRDIAPIC